MKPYIITNTIITVFRTFNTCINQRNLKITVSGFTLFQITNSSNLQPICLKFIQQWVSEDLDIK